MLDIAELRKYRELRFFVTWNGFVSPELVNASEQAIRALIDNLVALGPAAQEPEVRQEVQRCVERFNEIDQGWICTIERDDICDYLSQIVAYCGMDPSAKWIADNREW